MNIIEVVEKLISHQRWLNGHENGERADFTGLNLSEMNLSNKHLSEAIFKNCDLSGANLSECVGIGTDFEGANLTGANLSNSLFTEANFDGTTFDSSILTNSSFDDSSFMQASFANTDMRNATFTVARMSFPVYTFTVAGQPAVATPTELRIGDTMKPWSEWGGMLDLAKFFVDAGYAAKDGYRYVLHVLFFKKVLIKRGYNI